MNNQCPAGDEERGLHLRHAGCLPGRDIRHLAANELRAAFGVVPQETVRFSGTLYDNLVMAQPHARFEDLIEALPKGLQVDEAVRIGEHGTRMAVVAEDGTPTINNSMNSEGPSL